MRVLPAVSSLAALLVGCAEPPPPAEGPTYHGRIKDIVERNCLDCHRRDGIAPFPLETYEDVKGLGELFASVTTSRRMPPVTIDGSGACGTFDDVKWLTDDELADVSAWVENGAPEGEPGAATAPGPQAQALERVDAVLDMEQAYTPPEPETTVDDYRCFLVDPGLDVEKYVTAYEVKPGDPRVVHHVIAYIPADEAAEAQAQALDDAEEGLGYTCFGSAGVDGTILVGWAPGTFATRFPGETGVPLPAGRRLVMQVHYNVANGTAPDRTTIDLELADEVADVGYMYIDGDGSMVLPAGEPSAEWTWSFDTAQSARLWGVFPHMHELGRTMRVEVVGPDGSEECAVDVPRWDFHWQRFFFYQRHLGVEAGSTIRVRCTYDTTSRDEPVRFGEGTSDEMCVLGVYFTLN